MESRDSVVNRVLYRLAAARENALLYEPIDLSQRLFVYGDRNLRFAHAV